MNSADSKTMMKSPEYVSELMEAVAGGNIGTFEQKLTQGLKAVQASKAPRVPVMEQPGQSERQIRNDEPQVPVI